MRATVMDKLGHLQMRAIWTNWDIVDACNMDEHTVIIGGTVDMKRLAVGGPFALFSSV